jgi:hypothetical protein
MKLIFLKLAISFVKALLGSQFFAYVKLLVEAQLDSEKSGEEKRKAVKAQIENLKDEALDVVKGTSKEALVEAAKSTPNKYINLAIEIIVAAL